MISGFILGFQLRVLRGVTRCIVLTIDQVGHVLWLISKMSNYMSKGVFIY